jgi:hypothetical protein
MKKLLLSIGSFALSLSALNAAQLDLPENAAEIASDPNCIPLLAEAVLSPLPGEGDVDPFTTATAAESVESSQLERQSAAEFVDEEQKVEDNVQAEDTATATAEAAEAVTEGPLRARYELKGEMLYVIIDLPPNTEQAASATGHNRQEGAQQIKLTFERGVPNTTLSEAAEAVTEGPLRAMYELKGEMLYVIIDLPPNTEQAASATGHNRQEGAQQIKLTFERGVPNTTLSDTEEGAPAADPALPSR